MVSVSGNEGLTEDQSPKKQSRSPVEILEAQSLSDKVHVFNGQDVQKKAKLVSAQKE